MLRNLSDIQAYIAQDSPQSARQVITTSRDQVRILLNQPRIGRPGRVEGTRELVINRFRYIVVYRITPDTVDVLSVYHDARTWPETFE